MSCPNGLNGIVNATPVSTSAWFRATSTREDATGDADATPTRVVAATPAAMAPHRSRSRRLPFGDVSAKRRNSRSAPDPTCFADSEALVRGLVSFAIRRSFRVPVFASVSIRSLRQLLPHQAQAAKTPDNARRFGGDRSTSRSFLDGKARSRRLRHPYERMPWLLGYLF